MVKPGKYLKLNIEKTGERKKKSEVREREEMENKKEWKEKQRWNEIENGKKMETEKYVLRKSHLSNSLLRTGTERKEKEERKKKKEQEKRGREREKEVLPLVTQLLHKIQSCKHELSHSHLLLLLLPFSFFSLFFFFLSQKKVRRDMIEKHRMKKVTLSLQLPLPGFLDPLLFILVTLPHFSLIVY